MSYKKYDQHKFPYPSFPFVQWHYVTSNSHITCDPIKEFTIRRATPTGPPRSSCTVMVLAPDAVVMEMEKGSASTGGTVTMEIPIAAAERAEPEESVQHHGQHTTGAASQNRNYRMLIVIGEISTGHHLDAARKQITQGKSAGERSDDLLQQLTGERRWCVWARNSSAFCNLVLRSHYVFMSGHTNSQSAIISCWVVEVFWSWTEVKVQILFSENISVQIKNN